jgi:short subunit dehydrogenase-like uncharacterized protein
MDDKILIYGASGYTGRLFAKYLIANGYKPILASRSDKSFQLAKNWIAKPEYLKVIMFKIICMIFQFW